MPSEKESFEFFVREWEPEFLESTQEEKPTSEKPETPETRPEGGDAGVADNEGKEVNPVTSCICHLFSSNCDECFYFVFVGG